jgi:hypothetical protein
MLEIVILFSHRVVWTSYSGSKSCFTCHNITTIKISDTLYLIGSFYYNSFKILPFILAVDTNLNIKWYKAFNHNLDNADVEDMVKINDTLIAIVGGHGRAGSISGECPNLNCSYVGLFNLKTRSFVWSKYRIGTNGSIPAVSVTYDNQHIVAGIQDSLKTLIVKFDLYGNVVWQRNIIDNQHHEFMKVRYDGSANYLLLMVGYNGANNDVVLAKMGTFGNILWSKSYDFGAHDNPYDIFLDNDGYVIVATYCTSAGPLCGSSLGDDDILLFKTDFDGNIIWSKRLSSNQPGWGSEDRGYAITIDKSQNYFMPKSCIDIGQPVDPITGQIKVNFDLISKTCTPCVRINFILAQVWQSVNDPGFLNTYDKIINGFIDRNIAVYGLIGHEAVKTYVGYLLSYENPQDPNATNSWINEYVNNFIQIVSYFRNRIKVFESFNEPNVYRAEISGYWVHPKWFAKILQDIYLNVKVYGGFNDVKLISGPLLTDFISKGDKYLDSTYWYGKNVWSWNSIKAQTGSYPLDGIGMHIYVAQNATNQQAIIDSMNQNISILWNVIVNNEGNNLKKIWVSEFGWQSSNVGLNGQANNLQTGFNFLNNDARIAFATWFQLKDWSDNSGTYTWGIFDLNNNPKPSFNIFKTINLNYCIGYYQPGDYMLAGFIRPNNSSSYPIAIKVSRNSGDIIWSKAWLNVLNGSNSNEAKSIKSISYNKFFISSFLGSGSNAVGGLALLGEDLNSSSCLSDVSFNVFSSYPTISNYPLYVLSSNYNFYPFYFSDYNVSLNISNGCYLQPVSNSEISLKFLRNGYLQVELVDKSSFKIYSIDGKLVYKNVFKGTKTLKLKKGIYIISIDNKIFKIIVP